MCLRSPPKPPSKVNYRTLGITPTPIYRIALYDSLGGNDFGIFPTIGQQVQGEDSDTIATVIDSGLAILTLLTSLEAHLTLMSKLLEESCLQRLLKAQTLVNTSTIFEFGESITNLEGDTAIIEETNIDDQGTITDRIVVSKTSVLRDLRLVSLI